MKRFAIALIALAFTFGGLSYAADCGGKCFSQERTDIGTTSVNFAFGFSSDDIIVEVDSGNADDVCVDWSGHVAVMPATDTAGCDRLSPGVTISPNKRRVRSISIIGGSSCSAPCTVTVRAWGD